MRLPPPSGLPRPTALLVCGLLALTGCASTPADTQTAPADLARTLAGDWDTRVQAAAGGPGRVVAQIAPIGVAGMAPAGGAAVGVVWRAGAGDGPVLRRQVWTVRPAGSGGTARLEMWGLRAGAAADWGGLRPTDLVPAAPRADGADCGLDVTPRGAGTFDAASAPERCRATDSSGRAYGVATRITLMPTGLLYQEAGLYDDDTFAFKSPPDAPYDFRRP